MILVDSSVWIGHLSRNDRHLESLLLGDRVACHPFITGELACGNLRNRTEILTLLNRLPRTTRIDDDELLFFIEQWKLMGRGIGLVDFHLLASALYSRFSLWTLDKRLRQPAENLGIAYVPASADS